MTDARVRRLALGGVLAALIILLTFGVKIPVPATGGYVHPGDAVILLAGVLLGPYAALIGGVASALSDVLGGYFIYVPATFIIKGLMGGIAGLYAKKGKPVRNAVVFLAASLLMVALYFVFEGFVYSWSAAALAIGPNVAQGLVGAGIGWMLSMVVPQRL